MCRIRAEETTMPDGTTARRGQGTAQQADSHVARRLRERRLALGLTQQQVAELVGVTYQQAHKYEIGADRLSVGRLFAIAQVLGVEPGYFFEGLEAGPPPELPAWQGKMLELGRAFVNLPSRRHREAIVELARALAGS
jgi:transcriptional regulator with XRE-family HTH domain